MKFLIFSLATLIFVSCSTSKNPINGGREPSQWRGDGRRDDRRGGPGPGPGDGYGRHDGPNRDGRRGSWQGQSRNGRRCIGCFDRSRFNDVVELGNPVELMFDQSFGPREYERKLWNPICGIRSIAVEVQENEAQITGLSVHYVGDRMFEWDNLPARRNWDFRDGSDEGEMSVWFDVGANRRDDRVCIDGVRVNGFTYKDRYFDFQNALVQFYGSRSIRGVSDRPGPRHGGPGMGYGQPPMPGPAPMPVVITEQYPRNPVIVRAPLDCVNNLRVEVKNADDLYENDLCVADCGALPKRCGSARNKIEIMRIQNDGWVCQSDELRMENFINTDYNCVENLVKQVPAVNPRTGKPNLVKNGHRNGFTKFCSDQVFTCQRTRTVYR